MKVGRECIMSQELSAASDFISWVKKKSDMNANAASAKNKQVKRGEVYWCEFGLNVGSEMSKTTPRPAVIIQNNPANHSSSNTIVAPITHNQGTAYYFVQIAVQYKKDGSILLDGKVNVSHIITVSKARLLGKITHIPPAEMSKIDKAIARTLGIEQNYQQQTTTQPQAQNTFQPQNGT